MSAQTSNMNVTIYLPPKAYAIFKNATIVESEKINENEILFVNSDPTIEAALGGKSQIAIDRACMKYTAREENVHTFMKKSDGNGQKIEPQTSIEKTEKIKIMSKDGTA